tara:strand:- start:277 stop:1281 length:1005 start_codon:yes stop_codon:yes gene_type:complete
MNNMMPPLQANANDLAKYGRYGDSMLVHMNPAEVQGIASLSPTGQLTTNPVTGQPEAFLPFIAPLLAQFVPGALSAVGLGGLGAAAAGAPALTAALTSGLITGVAEGDLGKGIMAGITSFGMGKALGAASDAVNLGSEVGNLATAQTGLAEATKAAAYSPDLAQAGEYLQGVNPMANAQTIGSAMAGPPTVAQGSFPGDISAGMTASTPIPAGQQAFLNASQNLGTAQSALDTGRQGLTGADRLGSIFNKDGAKAGLEAFMKPEAILPTAIGAGNIAQTEAMEQMQAVGKAQEAKRMRRREMDRGVLSGAAKFAQPNNPFAGVFNKPGLSAFSG